MYVNLSQFKILPSKLYLQILFQKMYRFNENFFLKNYTCMFDLLLKKLHSKFCLKKKLRVKILFQKKIFCSKKNLFFKKKTLTTSK